MANSFASSFGDVFSETKRLPSTRIPPWLSTMRCMSAVILVSTLLRSSSRAPGLIGKSRTMYAERWAPLPAPVAWIRSSANRRNTRMPSLNGSTRLSPTHRGSVLVPWFAGRRANQRETSVAITCIEVSPAGSARNCSGLALSPVSYTACTASAASPGVGSPRHLTSTTSPAAAKSVDCAPRDNGSDVAPAATSRSASAGAAGKVSANGPSVAPPAGVMRTSMMRPLAGRPAWSRTRTCRSPAYSAASAAHEPTSAVGSPASVIARASVSIHDHGARLVRSPKQTPMYACEVTVANGAPAPSMSSSAGSPGGRS